MRHLISLFLGLACLFMSACNAVKNFTIYNNRFAATDLCVSVATIEMLANDSGIQTHIEGDASTMSFTSSDNITYWCEGVKVNFIGAVTYGGYVFTSNSATPLQFTTSQTQGFFYTGGVGTVTEPDGTIHTLPPSGRVTIGEASATTEGEGSELINVVVELAINVLILVVIVVGLMVVLRLRRRQSRNLTAPTSSNRTE